MNYSFQMIGVQTEGGAKFEYQVPTVALLDEDRLDESAGIGAASELARYWTIYFNEPAQEFIQVRAGGGIDWTGDGSAAGGAVAADINGDSDTQLLRSGDSEWGHLILNGGSIGQTVELMRLFGLAATRAPSPPLEELRPSQALRIVHRQVR
jgi:hypothetical protein